MFEQIIQQMYETARNIENSKRVEILRDRALARDSRAYDTLHILVYGHDPRGFPMGRFVPRA